MYFVRIIDSGKTFYLKFLFCQKKCIVTDNFDEKTIFSTLEDVERTTKKLVSFEVENNEKVDLSLAEIVFM